MPVPGGDSPQIGHFDEHLRRECRRVIVLASAIWDACPGWLAASVCCDSVSRFRDALAAPILVIHTSHPVTALADHKGWGMVR